MSFDAERLYNLLPAIHRLRDAIHTDTPGPLQELTGIIADQVAVLEEELEQLYDDQFVETAAPWVLPYLGDLLGVRGLGVAGGSEPFAPRAEVANTIAYRRRKGTAAMLEQLARDVMGRPAAAVEFWSRLATTQPMNHVRLGNVAWASLRNARQLEFIGTPFESATRTVEVRRIEPGWGRWNIPNVGLSVWRLGDYSRTRSPLVPAKVGSSDNTHFRVHPLGLDVPLCARPATEKDISHLAEPENVPALLTWRLFAGQPLPGSAGQFHPDAKWYGIDRSVQLWRQTKSDWELIQAEEIVVCNLHDVVETGVTTRWGHDDTSIAGHYILLDPLRGRVVLPPSERSVLATFCLPFPADIGGGEYARATSFDKSFLSDLVVSQQLPNASAKSVQEALDACNGRDAIIEIADSGRYEETFHDLPATGLSIELRARDGCWPALTLNETSPWYLSGNETGHVTLNGLLITGSGITVGGNLGNLRMRHCTLMAGLQISPDGCLDKSTTPRPPALTITAPNTEVDLENCILGPLCVAPDVSVRLRNCIVDAGSKDAWAISGLQPATAPNLDGKPAGQWRIENCTIIGRVAVHAMELASNTIFHGESVRVDRRQEGCVRFCRLPDDAVVPRRHKCVPRIDQDASGKDVLVDAQPQFVSECFGDAAYCLLSGSCSDAIRRGADDESEMGVYHDVLEPRREAHLRDRLRDYLRFGLEAGIFYEQQTPGVRLDGNGS